MSDINEDEVVHVDIIGKRKAYSESAYKKVVAERDLLQEGHRLIKAIAGAIINNADNPNFVRTKANNIVRWIEINTTGTEVENEFIRKNKT